MSGDGLLKGRNLITGNVTGNIFTVFPSLVIVVRPLRSLTDDAEFTALHVLDLSDLLQERLRGDLSIHGESI